MRSIESSDSKLTKGSRVTITMTAHMKAALVAVARENCVTVSDLIRESIIEFIGEQYPNFEEHYFASLPTLFEKEDKE